VVVDIAAKGLDIGARGLAGGHADCFAAMLRPRNFAC